MPGGESWNKGGEIIQGGIASSLALENGNLADIRKQTDKLTFDNDNNLNVAVTGLGVGDVEIGAVELKDHDSEVRVDIGPDGVANNALFVQSNVLALESGNLANIKAQIDKLTFDSNNNLNVAADLAVEAVGIKDAADVRINPAKEDGNLASLAAKDFATQTTLSELNTKVPSDPARENGNLASILSVLQGSSNSYYRDEAGTALTTSYVQQSYGFTSIGFILANDSTGWIKWSWDGVNDAGKLMAGETLTIELSKHSSIYLKGQSGGEAYRLIVW